MNTVLEDLAMSILNSTKPTGNGKDDRAQTRIEQCFDKMGWPKEGISVETKTAQVFPCPLFASPRPHAGVLLLFLADRTDCIHTDHNASGSGPKVDGGGRRRDNV